MTKEEYDYKLKTEFQFHDSIWANIAILGEAVNKLPKEITAKFPNISWLSIIRLRNIIIYDYFNSKTNLDSVWHSYQTEEFVNLQNVAKKEIQYIQRINPSNAFFRSGLKP